jgi:ubiquinone biosynthesis protein Coq4
MSTSAARLLRSLRGWISAARLFTDPSRLDMVFVMDQALSNQGMPQRVARLRANETTREPLDARRRLAVDVGALAAMPEGSVGRRFADFLRGNGLDPASIPRLPARDDEEYVHAHLYETHDLWHVLTGFRSDVAGEIGLQAVYAAQLESKLAMLLIGGGLLQAALRAPDDFGRRVDAVVAGWKIGREARSLFGVAWDRWWDRPLDELRRELGVQAVA